MNCNIPYPDLHGRLEGTTVLYRGKPYIVRTSGDEDSGTLYLYDFVDHGHQKFVIQSNDPDLDIATPPLGYSQTTRTRVVYLTRKPWRKWKQGLIWDALYVEDISNGSVHFDFHTKAVANTMSQVYPDLGIILMEIKETEEYIEKAVCNDIALVGDGELIRVWFRNELVGYTKRKDFGVGTPTITVPTSRKAWVVNRYLSSFGFNIVIQ